MSQITVTSDDGKSFSAYFAKASSTDAPGIVLIQEAFGVNAAMRKAADQWASLDYNVVCPDLYWRQTPNVDLDPAVQAEAKRGIELMQGMNQNQAVADLEASRRWMTENIGHDRIAGLGYCLGGRLAVCMAADTGVKCVVSYYGVGLDQLIPSLSDDAVPALLHIAQLDAHVLPPAREAILAAAKQKKKWEAYVYQDCDHAFARPGGERQNADATQLAQERSIAFMQKYLSV